MRLINASNCANNVSSPPPAGCPAPPRGQWWCCSHWPLPPMLGTWWQRCKNQGMDLLLGWEVSKSGWNIKTPRSPLRIIQKKPVQTEHKLKNAQKIHHHHHASIFQVGRRRLRESDRRRAQIGWDSSRDAMTICWWKDSCKRRDAMWGKNGKGGSQLLSL